MFSQTVEYALRAAVCLAQNPDMPLTTSQIAEKTHVPQSYLSKVLQALGKSDFIRATRGLHGGYQLNRPADKLSILDIVNAVDPIKRIVTCPLDITSHGTDLCPLHRRLDDALAHVEQALGETTLDQIVAEPSASTPLCAASESEAKSQAR